MKLLKLYVPIIAALCVLHVLTASAAPTSTIVPNLQINGLKGGSGSAILQIDLTSGQVSTTTVSGAGGGVTQIQTSSPIQANRGTGIVVLSCPTCQTATTTIIVGPTTLNGPSFTFATSGPVTISTGGSTITIGWTNPGFASSSIQVSAGGILSGGGNLTADRTISLSTSTLYSLFSALNCITFSTSTGQIGSTCLTGNQTITLSGAVTGSGTTSIATTFNTSTLYALFSGSTPISFNTSTGAISCPSCQTATTTINSLNGPSFTINATSTPQASSTGVVSSGSTISIAIPDAGSDVRGLVNTTTQTFAGTKNFSGAVNASSSLTVQTTLTARATSSLQNVSSTNQDVSGYLTTQTLTVTSVASTSNLYSASTTFKGITNSFVATDGSGHVIATSTPAGSIANGDTPYGCQFLPSNSISPNASFAKAGRTAGTNLPYTFLGYPNATTTSAYWQCPLPANGFTFNTTTIDWGFTSTSTATGTISFVFAWGVNATGTTIDKAFGNTLNVTSTYSSTTAGVFMEQSTTLTSSTFTAASSLFFLVKRTGAGDSLAKDAQLLWANLRFW